MKEREKKEKEERKKERTIHLNPGLVSGMEAKTRSI